MRRLPPARTALDNDGDGKIDFPADPGCTGPSAKTTRPTRPATRRRTRSRAWMSTRAKKQKLKGKKLKVKTKIAAQDRGRYREGLRARSRSPARARRSAGLPPSRPSKFALAPREKKIDAGRATVVRQKLEGSKKKVKKGTRKIKKALKKGKKVRAKHHHRPHRRGRQQGLGQANGPDQVAAGGRGS